MSSTNLPEIKNGGKPPAKPRKGRLTKIEVSDADKALRLIHIETHNQLMDKLDSFKDRLNSKGLPDSRGKAIFGAIQSQIYNAFGLTPTQREALKGDSHITVLSCLTMRQATAIYEVKTRLIDIYLRNEEMNEVRDIANAQVKEAITAAVKYYGHLFGK